MEKAVEIKRRAQRCVQNGDLDGALSEYDKLIAAEGADPYNFVLVADLLYKKGDQQALKALEATDKSDNITVKVDGNVSGGNIKVKNLSLT